MQKITPCLWFDTQAEEAAHFYVSVFKDSSLGSITRYGEGAPLPAGTVLTIEFTLDGQPFIGLNGGPYFKFSEAVSFSIDCKDQEEVDYYWSKLTEGGAESQCGWLKDKFGLSWQVVPAELTQMIQDKDPEKAARAMQAMLKMSKIDIATVRAAFEG